MLNAEWVEELTGAQLDRVRELLPALRDADGGPEIPADGSLPPELRGGLHLLASESGDAGALAGYAHLDTTGDAFGRQVAELFVHPQARGRGLGTELTETLLRRADTRLRIWSHDDHPAAAKIAERFGLTRARELLRMRLDFATAPELPPLRAPEGVRLRTFRPGADEDAVIAVNAKAFDWHPEQGTLSADDLRATEREDWFDPDGFFLAEASTPAEATSDTAEASTPAEATSDTAEASAPAEADGPATSDAPDVRLLGFHWTKTHPGGEGEVYVVGVHPDAQGGGLGEVLTLAGLHYLRERGRPEVILYVEGDNVPAVAVYRKLGFERDSVGVQYGR